MSAVLRAQYGFALLTELELTVRRVAVRDTTNVWLQVTVAHVRAQRLVLCRSA